MLPRVLVLFKTLHVGFYTWSTNNVLFKEKSVALLLYRIFSGIIHGHVVYVAIFRLPLFSP